MAKKIVKIKFIEVQEIAYACEVCGVEHESVDGALACEGYHNATTKRFVANAANDFKTCCVKLPTDEKEVLYLTCYYMNNIFAFPTTTDRFWELDGQIANELEQVKLNMLRNFLKESYE